MAASAARGPAVASRAAAGRSAAGLHIRRARHPAPSHRPRRPAAAHHRPDRSARASRWSTRPARCARASRRSIRPGRSARASRRSRWHPDRALPTGCRCGRRATRGWSPAAERRLSSWRAGHRRLLSRGPRFRQPPQRAGPRQPVRYRESARCRGCGPCRPGPWRECGPCRLGLCRGCGPCRLGRCRECGLCRLALCRKSGLCRLGLCRMSGSRRPARPGVARSRPRACHRSASSRRPTLPTPRPVGRPTRRAIVAPLRPVRDRLRLGEVVVSRGAGYRRLGDLELTKAGVDRRRRGMAPGVRASAVEPLPVRRYPCRS